MEISEITAAISTVGFPIAAFLLMFWYVKTESKETREALTQLSLVTTKLVERIDRMIENVN